MDEKHVRETIDETKVEIEALISSIENQHLSGRKQEKFEKKLEKLEKRLYNYRKELENPGHFDRLQEEYAADSVFTKMGNSMEKTGDNLQKTGTDIQNTGKSMMKTGVLITLWIFLFPVMLVIWIFKTAFGKKKTVE